MPVPTRRLALVALVLAGARLLLPDVPFAQGLLVLDGVLLAVAAADWLFAPAPGRVGVERSLPAVLTIDQLGEVSWRVTNPTKRQLHVAVADELAPSLHASIRRAEQPECVHAEDASDRVLRKYWNAPDCQFGEAITKEQFRAVVEKLDATLH